MVNYSLLQKKLPKYQFRCSLNKDVSFYYCNIMVENTHCKKGTLYIGYSKYLKANYLKDASMGFLLLDDPGFDIADANATIIFTLQSDVDVIELFHDVQCIFQDNLKCINTSSQFIDAYLHEKTIPQLVDISSQLLGNPIMLTNSSFKVLYMSNNQTVADKVWSDAKNLGCCSAESILLFKNDKASSLLFNGDKAFIYNTGLGKDIPRILKKLSSHNKAVGYFVVFEVNHIFEESHLELTDFLCNFLALQLKNNLSECTTEKIYEDLILDLLENKTLSDLSISDRVHSANWLIRPILRLMYIEVDTSRTLTYYFDYICSQLQHINPYAKAVQYQDSILVILNYNSADEYDTIFHKITKLLNVYHLHIGVSNTFTNVTDLYRNYIQAKTALTLGELLSEQIGYFHYKDYGFYHLLSSMDSCHLAGLCSSHYMQLSQYDKINNTEYCDTLYQYIVAANSLSTAANNLQIHRNTMAYRLEKIKQISDINLSCGEDLFQFYMTIKIKKWLNTLAQTDDLSLHLQ